MARRSRTLLAAVVLVLLLAASFTAKAIRPEPNNISTHEGDDKGTMAETMEECVKGAEGEEECMMRRILAAHTDYIYTQGHHH